MNINDYTGIPYDFRKRNCWHHVRIVRADAGLETPAFDEGHRDTKGLTKIDKPENFCAVLMGYRRGGRIVWHAGVYFDGMVSHCELASRQVRLDRLADLRDTYTEIEFWR